MRSFGVALALQSLSPALLFALSFGIARLGGPAEQGAFVSGKAWLDLLVALGCFGFPQSMVLAINRRGAARHRMYRDSLGYALALPLVFAPLSWVFADAAGRQGLAALALALGGAGVVLANLWRGILLTVDDGLRFHLITSAPAVALAVGVSLALLLSRDGLSSTMPFAIGVAGLLAVLLSASLARPLSAFASGQISHPANSGVRPDYLRLLTDGADVFVQAMAMALQAYLTIKILGRWMGEAEVGRFGMALLVFQALLMPLQMVSPLVFNRWTLQDGRGALNAGRSVEMRMVLGVAALVVLLTALVPALTRAVLGVAYEAAVPAIQLLLCGAVPALVTRIAALRLAAVGMLRSNSLIAVGRAGVAVIVVALCWRLAATGEPLRPATVAAGAFVLAEALGALLSFWVLCRARREQGTP